MIFFNVRMCLCVCLFGLALVGQTQVNISGTVTDEDGEAVIGANIVVEGTIIGTSTDLDGKFELRVSSALPVTLELTYTGYKSIIYVVTSDNQPLNLTLEQSAETLGEIVVSAASRVEESFLEAPVTIEKIDLVELRTTPSFDAYSALSASKGVQTNTGSLTFNSINTRGFADMQNWRFVQLIDGMEASSPGLNYPVGGNSGPADIDIVSIELVPGANSALYGANAFNGLLTINTKNPFYYKGLSAYIKGGMTVQDAAGSNPLADFGFRYAATVNNKFAFKVNFGFLKATDWTANDESYYINTTRSANPEAFLSLPRNDPNFDAVNVYGDEVQAQVDLDGSGTPIPINRTGIKEENIIDYDVEVLKGDVSLHYRLTDDVEASYGYRYIRTDAILRHTTIYPLTNFIQQFHRLELKGSNWNLKVVQSIEDAGDAYALLVTGGFIEQGRKSNESWASDYGAAFRGEVSSVAQGNHDAARVYADRDLPGLESEIFNSLRSSSLENPNIATGGSKFIDNSQLFSIDGNYDFSSISDILSLQIGGGYKKYTLDSEGQLFNDGPLGFNETIPVDEYGFYTQLGKKLFGARLHLRGSLRYDKHQDFEGKVTPRISGVYALDSEKKHNLRSSFQTGFRNPSSQEAYIALDIGPAILLGGVPNNVENYNYEVAPNTLVNGLDIHEGLITLASLIAFLQGGSTDPSLFVPANLPFLIQEKNTTWEIGYKGLVQNKLLIDFNYYHTTYEDLVVRITTFSTNTGRVYAVYTNIADDITSDGIGLGLDYLIGGGYKAGINYTYTSFDAEEAVANQPGFLPSFNTPENRFNVSFTGRNIGGSNFGFNTKFKYWDSYTWQSPFGAGKIESDNVVDLALTYQIKDLQSMVKFGASNLFNNEYRTVYGGPNVGSIYYISWTYDQMFN